MIGITRTYYDRLNSLQLGRVLIFSSQRNVHSGSIHSMPLLIRPARTTCSNNVPQGASLATGRRASPLLAGGAYRAVREHGKSPRTHRLPHPERWPICFQHSQLDFTIPRLPAPLPTIDRDALPAKLSAGSTLIGSILYQDDWP